MANSQYVAYLDDDNAWEKTHLSAVKGAIGEKAWAYSQRIYVDSETDENLGVDTIDSAGPASGRFALWGGFVDPNCLLVDKLALLPEIWRWSSTLGPELKLALSADRLFFLGLMGKPHARVEAATVRYSIRNGDLRIKPSTDAASADTLDESDGA